MAKKKATYRLEDSGADLTGPIGGASMLGLPPRSRRRLSECLELALNLKEDERLFLIEVLEDSLSEPRQLLSSQEVTDRIGIGSSTLRALLRDPEHTDLRPRVVVGADSSRPVYGISERDADRIVLRGRGRPPQE